MRSLILSVLIALGLCQLLLWILFELDTRRRSLSAARNLTFVGLIPLLGISIFLWYLVDREGFTEHAERLSPR